jgi:hypothetical protein
MKYIKPREDSNLGKKCKAKTQKNIKLYYKPNTGNKKQQNNTYEPKQTLARKQSSNTRRQ